MPKDQVGVVMNSILGLESGLVVRYAKASGSQNL